MDSAKSSSIPYEEPETPPSPSHKQQRLKFPQERKQVKIVDAFKGLTQDTPSGSFVTYGIQYQDQLIRRRYTEFEKLLKYLLIYHPSCIIPSIPEKDSLKSFFSRSSSEKKIIEKRKVLLESFLNRILEHRILGKDPVFLHFLTSPANFLDVLKTESISLESPIQQTAKTFDSKLIEYESNNEEVERELYRLEGPLSRYFKTWQSLANVTQKMGSSLNALSLEEPTVEAYYDRLGMAFDEQSELLEEFSGYLCYKLIFQFHEVYQSCGSIRNALNAYENIQANYEDAVGMYNIQKTEIFHQETKDRQPMKGPRRSTSSLSLVKDDGSDVDSLHSSSVQSLRSLENKRNEAKSQAQQFASELEEEMVVFEKNRKEKLLGIFSSIIKALVLFHGACADNWKVTVDELQKIE